VVASGRTGVRVIPVIPLRVRNRLRRPFATFAICSVADRPRPEAELPLLLFALLRREAEFPAVALI
jgi:hypothetical protein